MLTGLPSSISPDAAIRSLLARLARPARLLVAVSGGSDSLGLLFSLARHRQDGVSLLAVTVDHGLRAGSAEEAEVVGRICGGLGIPHTTKRWIGEKPSTGIAAAAREARYKLLCEAAEEGEATAILTGHTLDDQIETVTMRAARSPDPEAPGLAGMAEAVLLHRRHWLLRPLLRTRRQDIRMLLAELGQDWIDDPSNADRRSERVRTRMALADTPGVLLEEIDAASQRRGACADAAAAWLADHASVQRSVLMHVSPEGFSEDPAVVRYALSAAVAVLGGREQRPAADSLERLMAACRLDAPWTSTVGRVILDRRRSGLYLCRESRNLPSLALAPGAAAIWDDRFRISNLSDEALTLLPSGDRGANLFEDAPASIATRAGAALPPGADAGACDNEDAARVSCTPVLAPFDRFLPQFDLKLASAFAKLMGCEGFPALPVGDAGRKR